MHRLVDSRFGAALQCARMNPDRLATLGIAPFPVKLTAFTLSAMVTGLAGALFAELNGFVSPSMLLWQRSGRSEEHTSEPQSLMRISYAVFGLKNQITHLNTQHTIHNSTT